MWTFLYVLDKKSEKKTLNPRKLTNGDLKYSYRFWTFFVNELDKLEKIKLAN